MTRGPRHWLWVAREVPRELQSKSLGDHAAGSQGFTLPLLDWVLLCEQHRVMWGLSPPPSLGPSGWWGRPLPTQPGMTGPQVPSSVPCPASCRGSCVQKQASVSCPPYLSEFILGASLQAPHPPHPVRWPSCCQARTIPGKGCHVGHGAGGVSCPLCRSLLFGSRSWLWADLRMCCRFSCFLEVSWGLGGQEQWWKLRPSGGHRRGGPSPCTTSVSSGACPSSARCSLSPVLVSSGWKKRCLASGRFPVNRPVWAGPEGQRWQWHRGCSQPSRGCSVPVPARTVRPGT